MNLLKIEQIKEFEDREVKKINQSLYIFENNKLISAKGRIFPTDSKL